MAHGFPVEEIGCAARDRIRNVRFDLADQCQGESQGRISPF
ncbi:MAG: hypothetical protein AAFY19_05010 [Pseudomonadota bacterium]